MIMNTHQSCKTREKNPAERERPPGICEQQFQELKKLFPELTNNQTREDNKTLQEIDDSYTQEKVDIRLPGSSLPPLKQP